ncbi:MAG TPA: hypothetical protein VM263_09730, partial [Acidimicrobiales bacterium]|nr:hypothetical protein [Acidimicrobiales bacterium]
ARQLARPPRRRAGAGQLAGALAEVAALDAEAAASHRSWAEAAQRVQAAEDAGGGGDPLVVVDVGTPPERRAALLGALAGRAERSAVVVVAAAGPAAPPAPGPPAPGAAAPPPATTGTEAVDRREPVVARLLRLRARQAGRRPGQPPGSAAAG